MLQKSRELLYALLAIVFTTILYLFMVAIYRQTPPAFGFYGHSMGILGFALMLMTEILYTIRKRVNNARWGRMSTWLEFHIFTGLVGPYLVLLHTSWQFNGLAGVLSLFTLLIVISGFIGRYIYTAVPRTSDGVELSLAELEEQIRQVEDTLAHVMPQSEIKTTPLGSRSLVSPTGLVIGRLGIELQNSLANLRAQRGLRPAVRQHAQELQKLINQRDRLRRQVASMATARRLLSIWHAIHGPLGLTLFAMAFVHVIGAIYYASLLK
jgi:hypothetical protein